ncbi:MAG: cyclic nucleotide-binding domain-containing protein [Bdellovibrio sp.]|nr:cyclic nucleotide-binding domain-containing protein [Bdellovibrio sp.]
MSDAVIIAKGDYLVREGEESTQMWYLQKGSMSVLKKIADTEKQIGTIYAGEVVGEMSFLDKQPRCASVKAISDCELVAIPSAKFEKFFEELPLWYRALVHTLLERLRRANSRIRI